MRDRAASRTPILKDEIDGGTAHLVRASSARCTSATSRDGVRDVAKGIAVDGEARGQTTLTITIRYPSKEARDAGLKTGMKDGAAQSLDRLEQYLATVV